MLYALGVVLCWSLGSFGSSRVARAWGTGQANRVRLAISLVILLGFSGAVYLQSGAPQWAVMLWYVMAGVMHMGLGDLALFASYRVIGPRLGVLLCLCSSAPMALLMEWGVLGSVPSLWLIVLGAVVMVSVLVALAPKERLRMGGKAIATGLALGLTAGCCQAIARTLERYVEVNDALISPGAAYGTTGRLFGGLMICLVLWAMTPLLRLKDVSSDYDSSLSREGDEVKEKVWLWLSLSVILGPVVGVQLLHLASASTHGAIVQAVLCLLPMSIIPIAWIMDGDKPSLRSVSGGAVAILAVAGMAMMKYWE